MFPYTVKYTESEYAIQNNNLLYKTHQQIQNTFDFGGNLEKSKMFKRIKFLFYNMYSYFVVFVNYIYLINFIQFLVYTYVYIYIYRNKLKLPLARYPSRPRVFDNIFPDALREGVARCWSIFQMLANIFRVFAKIFQVFANVYRLFAIPLFR